MSYPPPRIVTGVGDNLEKTLADLEWPVLLDRLAARCMSEACAAELRGLLPAPTLEEARRRCVLTAQAQDCLKGGAPIPTPGVPELAELLGELERAAVPAARQLLDLARLLRTARELRRFASARRESHPELHAHLTSAPTLDALLTELDRAVDDDGTLSDSASTELATARGRARELRRELTNRLGRLVQRYRDVLSGPYHAERDGRYVLPVRSDAHYRVEGIVLGSSGSGGTLYVEPRELIDLGNRLRVADAGVSQEEARVLARLAGLARQQLIELNEAFAAALGGEILAVVARWAEEVRARVCTPSEDPVLDLKQARHPLLLFALDDVVANDLQLANGQALVVSGPNAGGKTVALKCLGLAALMARAGLPIPVASGSEVGWFDPVLSAIGDEQSLSLSLSTFSAHVTTLASILDASGPHALVLLDEVAAGTDPDEGSALAASLLEALVERGAAVAVTTHFDRLKELADETPQFTNASVGFDFDSMRPTFLLTLGIPGASSALAVATRFGIPAPVITRARELIPALRQRREELLVKLGQEQLRAEQARQTAEAERNEATRLRGKLELERQELREKTRRRLADEAQDLAQDVRKARALLRHHEQLLRREKMTEQQLSESREAVDAAARQLAIGSRLEEASRSPDPALARPVPSEAALKQGTRVRLTKLGQVGEVSSPPQRGQVQVLVGSMKLQVALADLRLDTGAPPKQKRTAPKPHRAPLPAARPAPQRTFAVTCDLRGQRVEAALDELDQFADQLLRRGEPAGFVLHGHGTGALKAAVREHLALQSYAAEHRPAERDEGGDAFTVFWLTG